MRDQPTFAFVTIGSGCYLGSTVRDLTLANALHRRGYKVMVYWMMEETPELVDKGIRQRLLCHGTRYQFPRPSEFLDQIIGSLLFVGPRGLRLRIVQSIPAYVDKLLRNLMCSLFATRDADPALAERLLKYLKLDGVSHLMMSFASIGPLALAAKNKSKHPFDYLLTFQGDEQFANYARQAGLTAEYRQRLNEVVQGSRWPAILVSQDYLDRIVEEMGLAPEQLRVVYNGIDLVASIEKPHFSILKTAFPNLVEDIPIVAYVGRQDSEKGIDLLLYAARLLKTRQVPLQLAICGATAKGPSYRKVIGDLADHLGLTIHHAGAVSPEIRNALYAHSRCSVVPSVNREAFGLVAAEAMSHGTPVIVPDYGGITEVIRDGENAGGLTFKTWDSGDLARQIERMLTDEALHGTLSENTQAIAGRFSIEHMTDCLLAYLGVVEPQASSETSLSDSDRPRRRNQSREIEMS